MQINIYCMQEDKKKNHNYLHNNRCASRRVIIQVNNNKLHIHKFIHKTVSVGSALTGDTQQFVLPNKI